MTDANLEDIGHMLGRRRMLGVKRMEVKIGAYGLNPPVKRKHCGKSGRKLELLLKAIGKLPNLREVDFNETDFKCVCSQLLVKTLINTEEVRNLDSTQMTSQQLTDLLTGIGRGCRLKRLNLLEPAAASTSSHTTGGARTVLDQPHASPMGSHLFPSGEFKQDEESRHLR